jgi:calcineurin-like phosphoesterase family protein
MKINLDTQKLFMSSDNHYWHANVIKYSNRPYLTNEDKLKLHNARMSSDPQAIRNFKPSTESVDMMNEDMIARHNAIVGPKDIVMFNGDFAFATKEQIIGLLKRLNGQKHLNLGNHDKLISKNPKDFIGPDLFQSIEKYRELTISYNTKQPRIINNVEEIVDVTIRKKIIFLHYGMRVWNHSHHGSWHIYGHSHDSLPPQGKSVDVGVDSHWVTGKPEYRPFDFWEIKKFMDAQEIVVVDHHDGENHE